MNNIEYQDIRDIIHGLSIGYAVYSYQLKEAKEKGSKTSEDWCTEQLEKINKAFAALEKLRKELCLAGDPLHSNKR